MFIFFLVFSLIFCSYGENRSNECITPSGRPVDCQILEEAKQILELRRAKEENERLKEEINRLRSETPSTP